MVKLVAMPRLGIKMTEGTVIEWCVGVGDVVKEGQLVLIIESDKSEVEIESQHSGVVRHIYVRPGQTVGCGTVLAALTDTPDELFDAAAHESVPGGQAAQAEPRGGAPSDTRTTETERSVPRSAPVAPAARRRAEALGLNPSKIPGTGPGGRVIREDVDAFASALEARVQVAEGVALEVETRGEGDRVLLLPGFGTDASAFARQMPVLSEHYRVSILNPRGVGLSDAPEAESYDLSTAAQDAAAVAGGPVHVIGASLGAAVALEMALGAAQQVRSLTLITPLLRTNGRLLAVMDAWCRTAAEAGPETLAHALAPWFFSTAVLDDATRTVRAVKGIAQMATRVPPATLARAAAGLRGWSGSREGDLARVQVRALVIAAERDLLASEAGQVARALPNARLVTIPGAGHAVTLEAPDAVNAAILEHLGSAAPPDDV
jgi:pimeloyl-ACP methyl ester carboxylesterase